MKKEPICKESVTTERIFMLAMSKNILKSARMSTVFHKEAIGLINKKINQLKLDNYEKD